MILIYIYVCIRVLWMGEVYCLPVNLVALKILSLCPILQLVK